MAKKKKKQKRTRPRTQSGKVVLYQRNENRRWYADLSAYPVELRGHLAARVALKAPGALAATEDAKEALRLAEVMERDLLLTTVARESGDGNAQQKSTTFAELVQLVSHAGRGSPDHDVVQVAFYRVVTLLPTEIEPVRT